MRTAQESRDPNGKRAVQFCIAFTAAVVLGVTFLAAEPAQAAQQPSAPPAASIPLQQANDPVSELIALSTSHFEAGQRELRDGHLEMAKAEFNKSLEVLLESRYGARTVPRIREHFDRLVERISAYELTALAQGDGFTEKRYEPATIDDLLTISTFEQPPATP